MCPSVGNKVGKIRSENVRAYVITTARVFYAKCSALCASRRTPGARGPIMRWPYCHVIFVLVVYVHSNEKVYRFRCIYRLSRVYIQSVSKNRNVHLRFSNTLYVYIKLVCVPCNDVMFCRITKITTLTTFASSLSLPSVGQRSISMTFDRLLCSTVDNNILCILLSQSPKPINVFSIKQ